jgi:excisionase family DNA binding protein
MNEGHYDTPGSVYGESGTRLAFYTVAEYALLTRFHTRTILNKIHSGEIPAKRVHGQWRIPAHVYEQLQAESVATACPGGDA